MQIQEHLPEHGAAIDSYRAGEIIINGTAHSRAVIIGGDNVTAADEALPQDLTAASFQAAVQARAEVILVGTGVKQHFLPPKLMAELAAHGIGLECMNTTAACRTYTLLSGEGRNVWAWLWP